MKKTPSGITDEITRRQWLLRLGEVGVLAGVSGFVPDVLGSILQDEEKALNLPPGLYEPSADAMVHALGSHGLVIPPPGSETEYALRSSSPFEPQSFSRVEFQIVTRVTEILLGKVDEGVSKETAQWVELWFHAAQGVREAAVRLDPLHRTLAIAYFGEAEVRELETSDHARIAREGLAGLQKLSVEKYGKNFLELNGDQQSELLQDATKHDEKDSLRKLFEALRNEAIRGYYTSAAGLKELDYKGNAYNPECPGCELGTEKANS
ncbi:MAG: gluconate 2-dehydrogenase subunit 3 family protein [Candidatus Sulfotelmatobacter sp.]